MIPNNRAERRQPGGSRFGSLDDYEHNPESDALAQARFKNQTEYTGLSKKDPANPNHDGPIDVDKWRSSRPAEPTGGLTRGQVVRTHDGKEEGEVIRTLRGRVFFRTKDGRDLDEPIQNVITVEKLEDQDVEMFETRLNEISDEVIASYKSKVGAKGSAADKKGDYKAGDEAYSKITKATLHQGKNAEKRAEKKTTTEGGMGGINRCAPANDVSYEKVLDEVQVKWLEEGGTNKKFTSAALGKVKSKVGKKPMALKGTTLDEDWKDIPDTLPPVDPKNKIDPWLGKPDKLAKAPVSSMKGSLETVFSELVKDSINEHGVKWAFEYYVKKHGLPPRQFRIFAGI